MNATTYTQGHSHKQTRSVASSNSELSYKIFIVEDNNTNQIMLENYLKKMPNCEYDKKPNLEIFSFETGKECIESLYIKPDIVILDYYLDESDADAENGLVVLKKIKTKCPNSKVIIMSGQDSVMVTAELFKKGASDYVSKEHYGIVRVGQSVLRLISEIEIEKKKRSKNILYAVLVFLLGMVVGWII